MGFGHSNAPGASYPELLAVREQANNAAAKANVAQVKAEAAQTTADAALEKANDAEGAAGAAGSLAAAAKETADTALTTASGAASKADTAINTANAAKTAAQNAATAAQNAQAAADAAAQAVSDINSTINAVPSQNGTLSYTGSAQTPAWNSYDTEKLTIGGETSATAVGDHSATFTPKSGFKWPDGTTTAKTVIWRIERATISIPTAKAPQTYTGSELTAQWDGYDSSKMTIGGTYKATASGTHSATFTPGTNYKWPDGTTTAKTVTWSISKAAGSLTLNKSTLSVTSKSAQTITATRAGDGTVTATSSNTSVATVSVSGTTITVTPKGNGSTTITVKVAAGTNHTAPADKTCAVTVTLPKIYGVQWDGTSTTAWTRTDDAALFTDPVPAVNNGNGSSPFDNLQPWAGMTRMTDSAAGELVKIPKFWYKWTKSGNTLKLQISDQAQSGFYVSPAHADRGDGKGERDVVYVGRYHCGSSNYKSVTGQAQKCSITRSAARDGIKALGTGIWQWDMAMRVTIQMLYLVEFADWDSQKKIGYGCSASGSKENNGKTDGMTYHTGTTAANRTTYGYTQYRNIEGLWDNVYDWLDGCYYNSNGLNIIKNPANFSDTTGGTAVGTPSSGYPKVMAVATQSGLEWVIYPTTAGGSETTYVPDYWYFYASSPCLFVGGYCSQGQGLGLFYVVYDTATSADAYIGCRLQKLP